jgi:hypothetical protein
MARQREHLEAMLGRPLLLDEARRLGQAMLDDLEAGSARPDIIHSAEITGGVLDLDGGTQAQQREARREFMSERFRDLERQGAAERGEDNLLNEQPPPTQDNYDLDDREERQAFMADRLRGVVNADTAYSSLDLIAQEDYQP